ALLIARIHSLKTPSRSTIRSCVRSKPSRCTFQYIHLPGPIVGLAGTFWSLRCVCGLFFGNQSALKEHGDFLLEFFAGAILSGAQFFRQPVTHLFAHEHGVGADVNDSSW